MTPSVSAASEEVFRAVADPTRRAMLDLLRERERTVGELAARFPISQPAVSQHLRVLRRAKLVRTREAGRRRVYRLNPAPVQAIYKWAAKYRTVKDPFGHVWAFDGPRQPWGAGGERSGKRGENLKFEI